MRIEDQMTLDLDRTVGGAVRANLSAVPERLAIAADGDRMTWGELGDAVGRAAAHLRARGLGRGDHLAILLPNGTDWAIWALASSLRGVTIVPANTKLRPDELRYQLVQSRAAALVVPGEPGRELMDVAETAGQSGDDLEAPALRHVIAVGATTRPWATPYVPPAQVALEDEGRPTDIALIQYTSGTTAFPRGAMITHGALLQDATGVASRLRVHEEDRYYSPSPFFHSGGSTLGLYLGLVTRTPIFTAARFDADQVLDVIEREGITMFGGIDALWMSLCSSPSFSRSRFSSVEKGWTAATGELFDTLVERTGVPRLVNLYGLSEASPNVTIADVDAPYEHRRTCGQPHSGFEIRIVDPESRAPFDRVPGEATPAGEIEVRGPCVMRGYFDKPAETAEVLDGEGWLRTGDRGWLRPDGALVYEGRYKHMLRVGGENVAAAEIESALLAHPHVSQAAVIGVPHDRLTEVPAAVVVTTDDGVPADDIVSFVAERLAPFKVPRRLEIVDELPTTGSGRIQKFLLEELLRP
jgi:acyl-CoA synthetase (AMP-forming)/AMP-acid ligase II